MASLSEPGEGPRGAVRSAPDLAPPPSDDAVVVAVVAVRLAVRLDSSVPARSSPARNSPPAARVRKPCARTAAPERDQRVTLVIDRRGGFVLESPGSPAALLDDERLAPALAAAYVARPDDHVLYLKADERAGYARVLTAVEAARGAGVRRIGAITEVPSGRWRDPTFN